jgi:hypothetical protein
VGLRVSVDAVERRNILPLPGIEGDIADENYTSINK